MKGNKPLQSWAAKSLQPNEVEVKKHGPGQPLATAKKSTRSKETIAKIAQNSVVSRVKARHA